MAYFFGLLTSIICTQCSEVRVHPACTIGLQGAPIFVLVHPLNAPYFKVYLHII